MARVLVPVMPRRYNHNPRGSATAIVTMKGSNPFESGVAGLRRVSPYPGQLAGLGSAGLGDEMGPPLPPTSGPATSGTTPIDWTGMVKAAATAAQPILNAQAARLLPRQGVTAVQGVAAQMLPVGVQYPAPKPASKLPYVLVGVGVIGLGAAVLLMRRKRK